MLTAAPVVAVLDDEPEMRKALRRLLTCRGFRVEEYECGEDLLAALSSHPLDYLLLDLHMPGINGFDVLETFRSRQIPVPVIVITAHDEPGTAERARVARRSRLPEETSGSGRPACRHRGRHIPKPKTMIGKTNEPEAVAAAESAHPVFAVCSGSYLIFSDGPFMKTHPLFTRPTLCLCILTALLFNCLASAAQTAADPGWPRVFKQDGKQLTVYQPQVDYWHGYTNLHFRCAIAVKGVFEAGEVRRGRGGRAHRHRSCRPHRRHRAAQARPALCQRVASRNWPSCARRWNELNPSGQAITLSLDRVIAYLDPATQPVQHAVELNLDPPKIFSSSTPAILVIFMGEPQFKPVETNRTDLLFALNTNWDVLYDTAEPSSITCSTAKAG